MKICIPTADDRGLASEVFGHFGSAPYLTLIEVDSGAIEVVPNPSCRHDHGSCHHTGMLRPLGVDAVVCGGMGRRALAGLREEGVEVLLTGHASVAEVLAAVRANAVRPLSLEESCGGGRHGHGHHGHGNHGQGGHHHRGAPNDAAGLRSVARDRRADP